MLTSFRNISNDELSGFQTALSSRWNELQQQQQDCPETDETNTADNCSQTFNLVYQCRAGTWATTQILSGSLPDQHVVTENGDKYLVNLMNRRGKNHGIFLDMANGRGWVRESAALAGNGTKVLNLFAYTCAFSIAALNGGASEVVNVDMSHGALKIGQRNHELNNIPNGRSRFLSHDIFKSWGKIKKLGPYDIIVVDPPSYQKGSFVAKKDYGKLIRRLPTLLSQNGGKVLLCLNAPELGTEFLSSLVEAEAPQLQFVERLANPDRFPVISDERALKVMVYDFPLKT